MNRLPQLLDAVNEKLVSPSRAAVLGCKDRLHSLINKPSVERERLVNEDELATQRSRPDEDTQLFSYDAPADALPSHRHKLLSKVDQCFCCRCRKRWQLAILANIGFIIVFGIRCNFGAARNHMARAYVDVRGHEQPSKFNWTVGELGVMEGSFFYGYLITQLPGGFLAGKFAPNKLFGLAIGAASFLNLLMPSAFDGGAGLVVFNQVLQGLVQGVSYPAMHGIWRYWAPPLERSKLATTAFSGSYAGAVIGLPASAMLVSYVGWASPFYVYGVCGLIWAVFWFMLTFEKPCFHPTITDGEKVYIERELGNVSQVSPKLSNIPWKAILTSRPVWAIIVANFARSWTFYLLLNHQLTYMRQVLKMPISESGFLAALPHAVMAIIVLGGGQWADYLRSRNILSTTTVRKLFNCGGFGGEAVFLLVVGYTRNPTTAIFALVLAVGSSGFAISGFNVNHLDIAPRYASLLMGMSNGVGTFSGMICPIVTETLRKKGDSGWETVFLLASLIHFTGVIFYAFFASGELQPWAEPPAEEEPAWRADDFAEKAATAGMMTGYGTANAVDIAPLPTREQLLSRKPDTGNSNGASGDGDYGFGAPRSPFADADNDPYGGDMTGVANDYYQGY